MRTINVTESSHIDHLNPSTLETVLGLARTGERTTVHVDAPEFAILTVRLREPVESVSCALRGPTTGEPAVAEADAFYGTRGERPNVSRLTRLPTTLSRDVTVVIAGDKLATAYGGPLAPQEPGDPYLDAKDHAASVEFWGTHALSVDGSPESSISDSTDFEAFSEATEKTPA